MLGLKCCARDCPGDIADNMFFDHLLNSDVVWPQHLTR